MSNSLVPIIGALERAHEHFGTALFGGRLGARPVIAVQTRGRRRAYGWYAAGQWVNNVATPAELNVSAEDLKRPVEDVLLTLAHEMVHQYADERGVKDVRKDGRFHTREFARVAGEAGLSAPAEPDKRTGYSAVTWGPEGSRGRAALALVPADVREAFVLARAVLPGKAGKGKMRLYVCACEPPVKVRCGRADLRARCLVCERDFQQAG